MPKPGEGTKSASTKILLDPRWLGTPLHMWFLLARTRDAIYRTRERDLSDSGLTGEQTFVLGVIHGFKDQGTPEKVTPAEISRQMFRESQSVSELLQRMERDGLVAKVKDLERRNMVRIEMTKKGHDLFEATIAKSNQTMARIMSGLSVKQREQLAEGLMIVREAALQELGVADVPLFIDFERPRRKRIPGSRSGGRNGQ